MDHTVPPTPQPRTTVSDAYRSPHALPEPVASLLRSAAIAGPRGDGARLRETARALCAALRGQTSHAEELVLGVKHTWSTLPEVARLHRADSAALLTRLVTLCIDEYYVTPAVGRDAR